MNPNPLAEYAHPTMVRIWSEATLVALERAWWVSVMEAQKAQGLEIPQTAIEASRKVVQPEPGRTALERRLRRIRDRELQTRHDVKARLEIFCEDAGHEYHHLGLTSADVVENTMQIRVRDSLEHLKMAHGFDVAETLWGREVEVTDLGQADPAYINAGGGYVLHGVHGPVGTDQDQLDLLGSTEKVHMLNAWLCQRWHFPDYTRTIGQVMHRSQDLAVLTPVASQVCTRLLGQAGRDRTENSRACDVWRACINGYLAMIAGYAGDTWNEGDVSSSVVRRVAIPNLLLAISSALNLTGA